MRWDARRLEHSLRLSSEHVRSPSCDVRWILDPKGWYRDPGSEICQIRHCASGWKNQKHHQSHHSCDHSCDYCWFIILSYSIIFYHILSFYHSRFFSARSLYHSGCHWFTVIVGDWKTGCGSNPPFDSSQPANFCWLQSVSARLRNNHVAGFSNMFYIVLPSKRKQLLFFFNFNGSCCVYNYIYIYIQLLSLVSP